MYFYLLWTNKNASQFKMSLCRLVINDTLNKVLCKFPRLN